MESIAVSFYSKNKTAAIEFADSDVLDNSYGLQKIYRSKLSMLIMNNFKWHFNYILIFISGILCIVAGIRGWKFPTIRWFRGTKYEEILNTIVMVLLGVLIIIAAIEALIS